MTVVNLDNQTEYWNETGSTKTFNHPVNLARLDQLLSPGSRIVDVGCGYGRVLGELYEHRYRNLIGFDPAPAMIAAARQRYSGIDFQRLLEPPSLPLPDASADAVVLFSVLTCIPTDAGQRAIVQEIERVLKPGGLFYISDLWLQTDERNRQRYIRDQSKYGNYGVFDLPEGVTVRHHAREWVEELTGAFQTVDLDNIDVHTMNGNPAKAFQWFGLKRSL